MRRYRCTEKLAHSLPLQGHEDTAIAAAHSIEAAKLIPNARLEIIANCGHYPQMEQAGRFNRVLGEFLAAHAQ
jgi:pimeloyl-ACP methyl ester carboxylesterase